MVFTDPMTLKYVRKILLVDSNSTHSIEVTIGEESGTTSNDGSASLPPSLCGNLDRRLVDLVGSIRLFELRLQSTWTDNIFDRHDSVLADNWKPSD